MKKFMCLIIAVIAAACVVMSCATIQRITERTNEKTALVYGYFNLGDVSYQMNWISLLQFSPPTEKPYWGAAIKNGCFFNSNLVPGEYCIDSFGADNHTYKISYEVGCFEIEKSDLYYFGAYEVVWKDGKPWTLKRTFKPGEAEVIEKILDSTDPGTYWDIKLRKRLSILREAEARKANIPRAPSPQ